MAGLGTVSEGKGLYLSIAGGFIWNRKADESDPNYATQKYERADKTEGVRAGARYADLTGSIVGVQFRTHDEYGESINVTVDAAGERYIISVSTNNRYSQDLMKALLKMDLEKEIYIKPYDFIGKDKKRAHGISFRQDGEKLNLRVETPSEFQKEKDFWSTAKKKDIKRFFEDLNDWFVAEVEEKVISQMADELPETTQPKAGLGAASSEAASQPADEVKEQPAPEKPKVTPLKMKAALKEYIAENYEGKVLPKLDRPTLIKWYELCQAEEELPWEEDSAAAAEVPQGDLNSQLDALIPQG